MKRRTAIWLTLAALGLGVALVMPAAAQAIYRALPPDSEGRTILVPIEPGNSAPAVILPSSKKAAEKRAGTKSSTSTRAVRRSAAKSAKPKPEAKTADDNKPKAAADKPQVEAPKLAPEPKIDTSSGPVTGTVSEKPASNAVAPEAGAENSPHGVPPGRKIIDPDHPVQPEPGE